MSGSELFALYDLARGRSIIVSDAVYALIERYLASNGAPYTAKQLSPAELMCHARAILDITEI